MRLLNIFFITLKMYIRKLEENYEIIAAELSVFEKWKCCFDIEKKMSDYVRIP